MARRFARNEHTKVTDQISTGVKYGQVHRNGSIEHSTCLKLLVRVLGEDVVVVREVALAVRRWRRDPLHFARARFLTPSSPLRHGVRLHIFNVKKTFKFKCSTCTNAQRTEGYAPSQSFVTHTTEGNERQQHEDCGPGGGGDDDGSSVVAVVVVVGSVRGVLSVREAVLPLQAVRLSSQLSFSVTSSEHPKTVILRFSMQAHLMLFLVVETDHVCSAVHVHDEFPVEDEFSELLHHEDVIVRLHPDLDVKHDAAFSHLKSTRSRSTQVFGLFAPAVRRSSSLDHPKTLVRVMEHF